MILSLENDSNVLKAVVCLSYIKCVTFGEANFTGKIFEVNIFEVIYLRLGS